ncbi:transcriptional regulator [Streptomyces hoynatensis]|uniref:Transcriptional regulator n=1 Tax=Streptomyces hoynatensis TaxID=1141874 RepID=A0A3A9YPJ4_9ACTN|nr:transcriptional regulator [Streptomyces hoynatensis]
MRYLVDTGFELREHEDLDIFLRAAPTRAVLELLASKWTMLVLVALGDGRPMRFNELRRRLEGVTQKMLTQTLRALERDGLLTRTVYPTVPPRVEYRLTALGGGLGKLLTAVTDWSREHVAEMRAARAAFEERAAHQPQGVGTAP